MEKSHDFDTIASTKIMMSRRLTTLRQKKSLWDQAADCLSKEDRAYLKFDDQNPVVKASKKQSPLQVLGDIESQIENGKTKQWRFRKSNGDEITVREVLERIAKWVNKFKEIGDVVVQYDPAHAALPWAALRFFLMITINEVERWGSIMEGVEVVAGIIARFAEVEKNDLTGRSNLKTQLENGLIKLYAAVLKYLAEVRHYYNSSTSKKIAKSLIPSVKSAAEERLERIYKEENDVYRLVGLVQAENQVNRLISIQASLINLEKNVLQAKTAILATRRRLLERLSATYTNDNYDGALSLRREGTATWIFDRDVFKKWMDTASQRSNVLWIYGGPGFGKTILAAAIVQYLRMQRPNSVAYFFCVSENEAKRDPYAILTSWVAQIIEQNDVAVQIGKQTVDVEEFRSMTRTEKWSLLRSFCQKIHACTFIIDGFDECSGINKTSRFETDDARAQFLQDLFSELGTINANVLIVSRDTAEIREELFRPQNTLKITVSTYQITANDTRPDIEDVSRHVVDFKLAKKPAELRGEIAAKAAEKSEGMFLWIHLLSQKLKPGINAAQLQKVVSRMPAGLEQAYERDLAHIESLDEDERRRAIDILRWVLFAVRPLTVREMVEALILKEDADDDGDEIPYPEDELPDSWKINYVDEDHVNEILRQPLGSLIELKSHGENEPVSKYTVHFVHYSVKEYLLRRNEAGVSRVQMICFPDNKSENDRLAKLCLQYLCYDVFGHQQNLVSIRKHLRVYPFMVYAARTWFRHAISGSKFSPEIVQCARRLLNPATSNWRVWSKVFDDRDVLQSSASNHDSDNESSDQESSGEWMRNDSERADDSVSDGDGDEGCSDDDNDEEKLEDEEVNEDDSTKSASPLYYASLLGFLDIVQHLHSEGLDINAIGGIYGSALQAAAVNGHCDTVKFLLEHDADVSLRCGLHSYALNAAAWNGSIEIVKLLVDAGADIESRNEDGGFRLVHYAAYNPEIMKFCLDKGCDLDACDARRRTPLYWSAYSGRLECAKMLLDAGVNINAESQAWGSALFAAVNNNHLDVVKILLERGIKVNTRDVRDRTCLHQAVLFSREDIVQTLLENGAAVEAVCGNGHTALKISSGFPGHLPSAKLLLKHDADVNHSDNDGFSPLHIASLAGLDDLVNLFIEHGADIDAETSSSGTPLMFAASSEKITVLKILLAHGADPKKYDISGDTSLDYAIRNQRDENVLLLLGQTVLAPSPSCFSPSNDTQLENLNIDIQRAIFLKDRDLVEAKLAAVSPPELPIVLDGALITAALSGSVELTKLFLGKGAKVTSITSNQRTALHYAASKGNLDVVKTLLDHGAECYVRDISQSLPLDLAIYGGSITASVVKYLIEHFGFGPDFALPDTGLLKTWESLAGTIKGSYTYKSWNQGVEEAMSFQILAWDDEKSSNILGKPPRFVGNGKDEIGTFEVFGILHGKDQVTWAKLYSGMNRQGWLYSGKLDETKLAIKGSWGRNMHLWHGDFTLQKEETV